VVAALRPYQNPDGGLPFVLPSVRPYPRAPWWQTGDQPPGSLLPTASIAGLLLARGLFADEVIETHLDALVAGQRDDGGWTFDWQVWTPDVEPEWRGWVTVETLKRLRAYGRLAG
jgi:hypothetical protein